MQRHRTDSIVKSTHGIDSLAALQHRFEKKGNRLGSIIALREWGKELRNASRFDEALRVHTKGMEQAKSISDTLEWVQGLNNMATDYRRMGVLDVAQEYHYNAWLLSQECADTTFTARKNQVVSLNGLGNIYLTLGNYTRADSCFRLALQGERWLKSATGQAINYANIGSIYEHNQQIDSAWVYYRKSMAFNQAAKNKLGISLCHVYYGSLHEKSHQYEKAIAEYEESLHMMESLNDDWHTLNSLLALTDIHLKMGNNSKMNEYLGRAKAMAEKIKSPEHLADIYTLYYKHYKQTGNSSAALSAFEKATDLKAQVLDMEKVNRIQNTSLNIERKQQAKKMYDAQMEIQHERSLRIMSIIISAMVLLALVCLVLSMVYTLRIRRKSHMELKHMSKIREHFFTNITHEFRTPLTVILGLSRDILEEPGVSSEIASKAKTLQQQGERLLLLINQLMDISKVKSSIGDIHWENGNVMAHIAMIVESYQEYATKQSIDLRFMAKEQVEMDFVPDYISKVLNNLLSNAFKFTKAQGSINVVVWKESGRLLIDVSDTGEGIAPEDLAHLFEPFYQAESNARHLGTGVGLSLVKQIIDAVKGSISVESMKGRGTTFHIALPIHNKHMKSSMQPLRVGAPQLPAAEVRLEGNEGDENACRLLVIEDNCDIAAYIGSQLKDNYAVSYAQNGKEGLAKALELVPDLIITDLMMPEMDGLEVCRQIRSNEIVSHIPIIIVTAKITDKERIEGIEAGADAYLAKPFNSAELCARVNKLLVSRKLLMEKFAGQQVVHPTEEDNEFAKQHEADRKFLAKVSDFIYLSLNRNQDVSVAAIASAVCMSERQLYRKMTALTGYTPVAYLQRVKILKAKKMLEEKPEMSLNLIAEQCGFDIYPNFVRSFKKILGVSPSEYRKQNIPE